jgi:uncharacterized protein YcnI
LDPVATLKHAAVAATVAVVAFARPADAFAHGTIRPALAAPGSTQDFTVVIPVTAQSPPVIGLSVAAPAGVRVLSAASAPPRWSATVRSSTVTWRGGPIAPGSFDSFAFRASVPSTSGTISFTARELYADGAAPPFRLNVVLFADGRGDAPAADDSDTRSIAIFALVLAIVALVLAAVALVVSLARWLRG